MVPLFNTLLTLEGELLNTAGFLGSENDPGETQAFVFSLLYPV